MEFYGILGGTLKHTISPIIHKKVFSLLNIEGAYKDFCGRSRGYRKIYRSFKGT